MPFRPPRAFVRRRRREPEWEATWSTNEGEDDRDDNDDGGSIDFDRPRVWEHVPRSPLTDYQPTAYQPPPRDDRYMRYDNAYNPSQYYYNSPMMGDGMGYTTHQHNKASSGGIQETERGPIIPYAGGGGAMPTYPPPPMAMQMLPNPYEATYYPPQLSQPHLQRAFGGYDPSAVQAMTRANAGAYAQPLPQQTLQHGHQTSIIEQQRGYRYGSPPVSPGGSQTVSMREGDSDATTEPADNTTVLMDGNTTDVDYGNSTVLGDGTTVLGDGTTVPGEGTTTLGYGGSTSLGDGTTVRGDGTTTLEDGTTTVLAFDSATATAYPNSEVSPVGSPAVSDIGSRTIAPTVAPSVAAAVVSPSNSEEREGLFSWMKNLLACEANRLCFGPAAPTGGNGMANEGGQQDQRNDAQLSSVAASSPSADRRITRKVADDYGNVYEGQLLDGKRDGIGKICYAATGDRYEGSWKDDKPHGEGRLEKGDGTHAFEGRWNEGMLQLVKSGVASVIDQEGNQYDGSFENWTKHGHGTLIMSNGEKYTGNWANGVRHGFGVLVYTDGSRFEGIFNNDQLTKDGKTFDPESDDDESETRGETKTDASPLTSVRFAPGTGGTSDGPVQGLQQQISPRSGHAIAASVGASGHAIAASVGAMRPSNGNDLPPTAALPSKELQRMVLTDDYTPSKQQSKSEKKAAKKIIKEMKKLEKMQQVQEHQKKKQIEALLKAEVKQKRLLAAQVKREQKKMDERHKLQAKALVQAKAEQEKKFAEMSKMQEKEMKMRLREIERLQRESSKKVGLEKRRAEKELNEERTRLQKFEEAQREELDRRQGELDAAQRKFVMQQQKAMSEQRAREQALNLTQFDSMKYKAEAKRSAAQKKQKLQREAFEARTREISRNWQLQSEQEQKNRRLQEKSSRGGVENRDGPETNNVFGLGLSMRKQSKNGKKGRPFGRKREHDHMGKEEVGVSSFEQDSFDL